MNYLRSRTPFEVRDAVSINGVRQKIMNLTSSFAEMAWNVDENVIELEKQRTELEDLCSVDEIQKRMDLTVWLVFSCQDLLSVRKVLFRH